MENKTTHFEIISALLREMEEEAVSTRKMLATIPDEQLGYKPHEKSMVMSALAAHIADIPSWVASALQTEGIDFATTDWEPKPVSANADILAIFDHSLQQGREALQNAAEADLNGRWVLRNGDHIIADMSKYETIRHAFGQTAHHRAQLGVYLRLLHIPIPGVYGPSADEMDMMAAPQEELAMQN